MRHRTKAYILGRWWVRSLGVVRRCVERATGTRPCGVRTPGQELSKQLFNFLSSPQGRNYFKNPFSPVFTYYTILPASSTLNPEHALPPNMRVHPRDRRGSQVSHKLYPGSRPSRKRLSWVPTSTLPRRVNLPPISPRIQGCRLGLHWVREPEGWRRPCE